MKMTFEEMLKRSHEAQFGKMTKREKSEYFRNLQQKRKQKKGRYSKSEANPTNINPLTTA